MQGILGVALPIPEAPGLSVTAEGRFMGVLSDETFSGTPVSVKLGNQYNYSGTVGLRYALNVAPPAPPPAPAPVAAPAPAPSRTYLVFFDWDKADLTDRARQIIAESPNGHFLDAWLSERLPHWEYRLPVADSTEAAARR